MSKTWMPARQTVLRNARIKIFSFAAQPFFLTNAVASCGGEQSAPCVWGQQQDANMRNWIQAASAPLIPALPYKAIAWIFCFNIAFFPLPVLPPNSRLECLYEIYLENSVYETSVAILITEELVKSGRLTVIIQLFYQNPSPVVNGCLIFLAEESKAALA